MGHVWVMCGVVFGVRVGCVCGVCGVVRVWCVGECGVWRECGVWEECGVWGECGVCGEWGVCQGVWWGVNGVKVSLAALLSGYLGKSGHLPRL